MGFGTNLDKCISDQGLKKTKVAEMAHIKYTRFSSIIHEKNEAHANDIIVLCQILKVTPNDLLGFNTEKEDQ